LLLGEGTYQAEALGVGRGEDFRAGDSLTHVTQSHVLLVFARLHTQHSTHTRTISINAKVGGPQISSASRKYAELNNWLDLRTFCKCGTLQNGDLRTQSFSILFADLKLPQVRKFILFLLTDMAYNALFQIRT
jgi:hypothetical protein